MAPGIVELHSTGDQVNETHYSCSAHLICWAHYRQDKTAVIAFMVWGVSYWWILTHQNSRVSLEGKAATDRIRSVKRKQMSSRVGDITMDSVFLLIGFELAVDFKQDVLIIFHYLNTKSNDCKPLLTHQIKSNLLQRPCIVKFLYFISVCYGSWLIGGLFQLVQLKMCFAVQGLIAWPALIQFAAFLRATFKQLYTNWTYWQRKVKIHVWMCSLQAMLSDS